MLTTTLLAAVSDAAHNDLYFLTAFGAGVISFLSPCVLPIVPGYLSFVTGMSYGELQEARGRALTRIAINTGMFVLGFTVVFVLLGLITTAAGQAIFDNQTTLTRIAGVLVMLMAAYLAASQIVTSPVLARELRFHPHLERVGPAAAPIAGAAFGLAWTPCIGPVLGSILGFAAQGDDLWRAGLLLVAYSAGLGFSFLLVGLTFGRLTTPLAFVRRHSRAITLATAAMLGVFGVILITDSLPDVTARLADLMRSLGLDGLVNIG
jgi:cytochrome c-type biogenesis protein